MNKSHLLINEPALQVLPSLAKAVGLEEAIILQQLHYWLNNPKVEGREHDGKKWIFNTYTEWQENFPFWSIQQIQRFFLNLEKLGVVISAKLDAKKHDQTKFYTLDYDALCTMDESILIPSSVSNPNDVNKELHRLPENNQPAEAGKPDMLDGELSKLPALSIRKAITQYFGINVNWETKTSRQFLEWANGEGITAEQIETAAQVWREDKQFNWQHPTLKGIFEKWNLLMQAAPKPQETKPEGKGFYA